MSGLCECGCGRKTKLAPRNDPRKGWLLGQPMRFISQHHTALSPVLYLEDPETGCWVWQRVKTKNGYPMWKRAEGGTRYAHRIFYEREHGPIPAGLELDHLCRNRACVNPAHLEPVTGTENKRRGSGTLLTAETARAIFSAAGTHAEIGRKFGVAPTTVSGIKNRQRWADVTSEGSK